MVIDTSALAAIFLAEPERRKFLDLIVDAGTRLISAANALETGIVLEARRGEAAGREFDLFWPNPQANHCSPKTPTSQSLTSRSASCRRGGW